MMAAEMEAQKYAEEEHKDESVFAGAVARQIKEG